MTAKNGGSKGRRPTYEEAQNSWAVSYLLASQAAWSNGLNSYDDNKYELAAKNKRDNIMSRIAKANPKSWADGIAKNQISLCP